MQKTAPSFGRIAIMVVFALSCFGLLLYLWLAFGGPVPLKPAGYRFKAEFAEATTLAQEAEVRVSGVPVGKVKGIEPDPRTGRSLVTLQIARRYAPVRMDTKAILRQKTLLGETYVELTPGTKGSPALAEGGRLPVAQISPTVELDEIYRAFDAPTRRAFQGWMQGQAQAVEGRGSDLNDALGQLAPFADELGGLVDTLNSQQGALQRVVADTGTVFGALSERQGQLRSLIRSSNTVFATTARNDRRLQELFTVLPTFQRESRQTIDRLDRFARDTDPLIDQLRPAARQLSPTLESLRLSAPDLRRLFEALGPLVTASERGFPAASRILDDLRPLLGQVDPALRQLNPMLEFLGLYRRELATFLANSTAATQAQTSADEPRYLRTTNPLNVENLAAYPRRVGVNRSNPYPLPGAFAKLREGLDVFDARSCGNGTPPPTQISSGRDVSPLLLERVRQFAFYPPGSAAAPCRLQANFDFGGERTRFPHVREKPAG